MSPILVVSVKIVEVFKLPSLSYILSVLSASLMEFAIPYLSSVVSRVASIAIVSLAYSPDEVTYFPATVVVKSRISARFDVPPVKVAFSIVNLELSSSQLAAIPCSCNLVIKSSIVVSVFTETVLSSPRILNIAVPSPLKPKLPNVVALVALTVSTTV